MPDDRPPRWEDLERAALHCPVLHQAVTLVLIGAATREEALIAAALQLSEQRATMIAEKVALLSEFPSTASLDEALAAIERIKRRPVTSGSAGDRTMSDEDPRLATSLALKLEELEQVDPAAFARLMRLMDRMLAEPDMSATELAKAIREAWGDPPGRPS